MRIIHAKDYDDMSRKAAAILAAEVILDPHCVLGLATGGTPIGTYKQLISWYNAGEISFADVTSINLDEYFGLSPDHPQSYRYFMNSNLFDFIDIKKENTFVPNGLGEDAVLESARYEKIISDHSGISIQLLGIGNNGHIAFNEPCLEFVMDTHKVALTESTIEANKRFFDSPDLVPRFAYTMGIRSIMSAKRILIIASGNGKAEALQGAFCGPVSPKNPASILQLHNNVILIGDSESLALM